MTDQQPPPPPTLLRYGIWLIVGLVAVAGVFLYFKYQTSLTPMLGGGK